LHWGNNRQGGHDQCEHEKKKKKIAVEFTGESEEKHQRTLAIKSKRLRRENRFGRKGGLRQGR